MMVALVRNIAIIGRDSCSRSLRWSGIVDQRQISSLEFRHGTITAPGHECSANRDQVRLDYQKHSVSLAPLVSAVHNNWLS